MSRNFKGSVSAGGRQAFLQSIDICFEGAAREAIMKSSLRQTATPQHRLRPRGNDRAHYPRRRFLGLAAGAAALPIVSRIASAQAYPTRPITLIVPFAAG